MSITPQPSSPRVHISTHPLLLSKLTQLRLHDLPAKDFREGVKAIG
jgi:uracil phosphoribosyltransferase